MRREPTIVGLPIPGVPDIGMLTSEDDWVVTGVHGGEPFKRYVSSNAGRDDAIRHVAMALRLKPDRLEWITAQRRHEVEQCIRPNSDWLRSRTL